MKKSIFIVAWLLPCLAFTQSISGVVTNNQQEPLVGASVYWLGTTTGVATDGEGKFEIEKAATANDQLVASFIGFQPDTIKVTIKDEVVFSLSATETLDEVVVQGRRDGVIISNLDAVKTENINQTELKKAACCDLAGCFSTQSSVQPQTTNVLTNAKELRILGLSGVYNQVLIDGFPMIQGLSYTYGISNIPGTLVDNIFIAVGANSVLQGYEGMSGQINVLTKKPEDTDQLLLNAYINSFGEKQFNANYAFRKGKWSNLTAVHTVQPADKIDRDEDNFLDLPQLTRYMVFNKLQYGNPTEWGWSSTIGLRFVEEQRIGGTIDFDADQDQGSDQVYGQTINFSQPEITARTSYGFNDDQRITIFASSFFQDQESYFGTVAYDARQLNVNTRAQFELNYAKDHSLMTGLSYRHFDLRETIDFTNGNLERTYNGNYRRKENVPGVFAENTLRFLDDRLTWIAGIRADHHNQFGWKVTPRTLLKYDLSSQAVVRGSIGTGWRTVNLFSENINLLVSSRDIIFEEALEPEQAVNMGVNYTHKIDCREVTGYFSADFYHTNFQNQIFPDYDSDPTLAVIKNFKGKSVSNSFQAEINLTFWQRMQFKTGYNYLDVYRKIGEDKQLLPFNSKHRVLTTVGFHPLNNKFQIDVNWHWYGKQRLPNTQSNPEEFQRPDFSKPYSVLNAQLTYNVKQFELYGGCENIFNFRQNRPIISWQNPFGRYFDTSSVWGPTRGREWYLGVRFRITDEE